MTCGVTSQDKNAQLAVGLWRLLLCRMEAFLPLCALALLRRFCVLFRLVKKRRLAPRYDSGVLFGAPQA